MKKKGIMISMKNTTLCWSCKCSGKECSWLKDFTPVKGWKAKKFNYTLDDDSIVDSYIVIKCPLYRKEK